MLPPAGLPGLDLCFSRLVEVAESGTPATATRTWHLLDNAARLAELGVTPVGTVLCVHGNPTWSYLWREFVTAATDAAAAGQAAWRVIAVDQLEMGFSERTGTVRPLARRVADLGDLTDALGLAGPVVTFGHDWGGVVSLGWAVDHPALLGSVMLLNTAVHQPEDSPIPAPLRLALAGPVLAAATVTTPAFLETTLALAHPPLPAAVKRAYRAPYRGAARRGGIGAFVADIPVDFAHESAAELDRIAGAVRGLRVPALMLWGPRDPIFSDRYLDDLVGRLPHADVHRYEGAGHLVAEDVDYAAAALTWLGERKPASPDLDRLDHRSADREPAPVVEPPPVVEPVAPDLDRLDHRTADREPASVVEPPPVVEPVETPPAPVVEPPPVVEPVETPPGAAWAANPHHPLWHYLDELHGSDETALVDMAPPGGGAPRVVSWRMLSRQVRRLAAGLDLIGVRKGDRVSLLVPPGADLTAVVYACLRIGAVVVVADAGLGLRGLTRAVRGAHPDHVIGAAPGLVAARAL
ncbi:alpha/beta fold hydrolase, partial [Cryobacterium fucosi]